MKHISKTQKIAAIALGTFIVSIGVYVYFFFHIQTLNNGLHDIEAQIAELDVLIQKEQEIKMLLEETRTEREALKKRFVSLEDPTEFLQSIEQAATDAQTILEIAKVETKDYEGDSNVVQQNLVVNFTATGRWEEIYRLLSLIELMPYETTISSAAVKIEENDTSDIWTSQVQLQAIAK